MAGAGTGSSPWRALSPSPRGRGGDAPTRTFERRCGLCPLPSRPSADPNRRSRGNAPRPPARDGLRLRLSMPWRRRMAIACAAVPGLSGAALDARHHVEKAGVSVMVAVMMMLVADGSRKPEALAMQTSARAGHKDRGADPGLGSTAAASASTRSCSSGQGVDHGGGKGVARDAAPTVSRRMARGHPPARRPARRRDLRELKRHSDLRGACARITQRVDRHLA